MRQCLFCDNTANSREHFWPKWILESLGQSRPIQGYRKTQKLAFRGPVQFRGVCASCNNGWMCDLEGTVRPALGPMLHDVSRHLDETEQRAIGLWAIKTAMVLELGLLNRSRFFTREECEQFRLSRTIPARTMVWLERMHPSGISAFGRYERLMSDTGAPADGYVMTYTAGYVAIQVYSIHFSVEFEPGQIPDVYANPGPWDECLFDILPATKRILWPPLRSFSQRGDLPLGSLHGRWHIGNK
jgi:hypothetical protein